MRDLTDIAEWGGNQHGVKQRLVRNNSPESIREATREAVRQIGNPAEALRSVLVGIQHWGLAYGSKTLRFICPKHYPALDRILRSSIDRTLLPTIYDGNVGSMVRGYLKFVQICRVIQGLAGYPGPRSGGWLLADVEMALFQFAWDGGQLAGNPGGLARAAKSGGADLGA